MFTLLGHFSVAVVFPVLKLPLGDPEWYRPRLHTALCRLRQTELAFIIFILTRVVFYYKCIQIK